MKAAGGVPPLTWLVNGAPVAGPGCAGRPPGAPTAPASAPVSVIDARGATDSVVVRIE